eukprot:1149818-Pelagomonas_calceolata.AAC.3
MKWLASGVSDESHPFHAEMVKFAEGGIRLRGADKITGVPETSLRNFSDKMDKLEQKVCSGYGRNFIHGVVHCMSRPECTHHAPPKITPTANVFSAKYRECSTMRIIQVMLASRNMPRNYFNLNLWHS